LYERAIHIRQTYKWVRIWFSGGSDSHLIIETFRKHNIHIDEIIVLSYKELVTKFDIPYIKQEYYAAHDYINTHKTFLEKTIITDINVSRQQIDYFFKNLHKDFDYNKVYLDGLDPRAHLGSEPYYNIKYRHNSCNVIGSDKPQLLWFNNKFYANFNSVNNTNHLAYKTNSTVVKFFTDPHDPIIHIKQCQLVRDRLLKLYSAQLQNIVRLDVCEYSKYETPFIADVEIELACRLFTNYFIEKNKSLRYVTTKHPFISQRTLTRVELVYPDLKSQYLSLIDSFVKNNNEFYYDNNGVLQKHIFYSKLYPL